MYCLNRQHLEKTNKCPTMKISAFLSPLKMSSFYYWEQPTITIESTIFKLPAVWPFRETDQWPSLTNLLEGRLSYQQSWSSTIGRSSRLFLIICFCFPFFFLLNRLSLNYFKLGFYWSIIQGHKLATLMVYIDGDWLIQMIKAVE